MKLQYLGDALDHWKGSIISRLCDAKLLHELKVDQMATDISQWGEVDHALYADLLRIDKSALVHHKQALEKNRKAYFEETLAVEGDIFLDPDTGICTNMNSDSKHLRASELHSILDSEPARIVMVYQHISRCTTRERVLKIFDYLRQKGASFHACSYESPSVAMLFFSRRATRLHPIGEYFEQKLDWHADKRVLCWEPPTQPLRLIVKK